MRPYLCTLLLFGWVAVASADVGPRFGHKVVFEYVARLETPIPGYQFFLANTNRGRVEGVNRVTFTASEPTRLEVATSRIRTELLYAIPDEVAKTYGSNERMIEAFDQRQPRGVTFVSLRGDEEVEMFDTRTHIKCEVVISPGPNGPVFEMRELHVQRDWSTIFLGTLFAIISVLLGMSWVRKRRTTVHDG